MNSKISKNNNVDWQLITDHYHRVVENQYKRESYRETLFWISFGAMSLLLLDIIQPTLLRGILTNLAAKFSVPDSTASFFLLRPMLWISNLYVLLKYFQVVLLVDREYDYIYELEEQLGNVFPNPTFRKEGVLYAKSESLFRNYIWVFYRYFIPALFLSGSFFALVLQFKEPSCNVIELALGVMIVSGIILAWISVKQRKPSGE